MKYLNKINETLNLWCSGNVFRKLMIAVLVANITMALFKSLQLLAPFGWLLALIYFIMNIILEDKLKELEERGLMVSGKKYDHIEILDVTGGFVVMISGDEIVRKDGYTVKLCDTDKMFQQE